MDSEEAAGSLLVQGQALPFLGGRGGLAPHPTPWGLPLQSPCRASGDTWLIPDGDAGAKSWRSFLGMTNEGPGAPRWSPGQPPPRRESGSCPPPATDSGARYQPHGFLISPALATHPQPVATTNPAWGGSFPGAETNGTPWVAPRLRHPSFQDSQGVTGTLDPQFLEREETGNGFICGGWKGILVPCFN